MTMSASGFDLTPPNDEQRARLEAGLDDEARRVLLHHGTEAPFCGGLLSQKKPGVYCCRLCGLPLFRQETKFESGTGWPSFYSPFDPSTCAASRIIPTACAASKPGARVATAIKATRFPDGPRPTGMRYASIQPRLRSSPRPAARSDGARGRAKPRRLVQCLARRNCAISRSDRAASHARSPRRRRHHEGIERTANHLADKQARLVGVMGVAARLGGELALMGQNGRQRLRHSALPLVRAGQLPPDPHGNGVQANKLFPSCENEMGVLSTI